MDREQIIQRFRDDPANTELPSLVTRWEGPDASPETIVVVLTGEDRNPKFEEWADAEIALRERDAEEAPKRTRRQQFVAGMAQSRLDFSKLDDETIAVSQLEFRRILKRAVRANIFLGEILQDLGQIERENGQ